MFGVSYLGWKGLALQMIGCFRSEIYFLSYPFIMLYCLLMERQRRNGLKLIMPQLIMAEKKTQQHWVSGTLLILLHTYSFSVMAPLLSILLTSLFRSDVYTAHWHVYLLSPHHFVWHYQYDIHHPKCCTLTNLSLCTCRCFVIGREAQGSRQGEAYKHSKR